MFLKITWKCNF